MTLRRAEDDPSPLAQLAAANGLKRLGGRAPLAAYIRDLWQRRAFLWVLANSRSYSRNQNNYLGQLWGLLNPLTLAAVYLLVFGYILDTSRGVDNFVGFLVIGIFIFQAMSKTITAGSTSITNNMSLVRALHFPRALLPLSVAVAETISLTPALVVMLIIVLATGESLSLTWLLLPVAVLMFSIFSTGVALIAARLVVSARDLRNLIPVAIRLLRYVSGVFFLITAQVQDPVLHAILDYQPVALYLTLVRSCLLGEFSPDASYWLMGVGWAVVTIVVGFIFFWQAEERYGRD